MNRNEQLYFKMMEWDRGEAGLIQHFAKVHEFAVLIGKAEGLDAKTLEILETAALVHDIGIIPARKLYGNGCGKNQEKVSDGPVREMLGSLGYEQDLIDRVAYLVNHHHTYDIIDGPDYQILVEADFLVNLYEESEPKEACQAVLEKIFKTETGKNILRTMFLA